MIQEILIASPVALKLKVDEAILNFKSQKIEKLKEEYKKLYPDVEIKEIKNVLGDVIGTEEEPIVYIEYDNIDSNGNKHYVTEKITIKEDDKEITYNVYTEDGILNPDVKTLLEEGKIKERPTLEKYLQDKIEELKLKEVTDSDYNLEPVEIPTDATEEEKEELERLNQFKEELKETILEKIQEVADMSHDKAEKYLADKQNLTLKQVQRYLTKYELAKAAKDGDEDAKAKIQLEADLTGIDVDTLIDTIITLGETWQNAIKDFEMKIEAVRVATQRLLETDPKKAIEVIVKGSQLKADVTDEEIKALFE